jgi:hypothetical protein
MARKKTLNEEVKGGKKIKTVTSIEFKGVNFAYRKVNITNEETEVPVKQNENLVL